MFWYSHWEGCPAEIRAAVAPIYDLQYDTRSKDLTYSNAKISDSGILYITYLEFRSELVGFGHDKSV